MLTVKPRTKTAAPIDPVPRMSLMTFFYGSPEFFSHFIVGHCLVSDVAVLAVRVLC